MPDQSTALIDATSLKAFWGDDAKRLLAGKLKGGYSSLLPPEQYLDTSSRHILDVLQRIVVYDRIIVDELALESLQLTVPEGEFGDIIHAVTLPSLVYSNIENKVSMSLGAIRMKCRDEALLEYFKLPEDRNNPWHEGGEEDYHDRLFPKYSNFANSYDSPARTLFYLCLSEELGMSPLITPRKQAVLVGVEKAVFDFFVHLETKLDGPRKKAMAKAKSDFSTVKIPGPPIVEMIWKTAYRENLSLIEAALKIRQLPEAVNFRRWLHKVETLVRSGTSANVQTAVTEIKKLEDLARKWVEQADPDEGVKHVTRPVQLGKIPSVGWFPDIFDLKESFSDPVLEYWLFRQRNHICFVSSWYR